MRRFADISETVPRQFSVAGAALRPFCVGHKKLLSFLELPFGESEKDEADLSEVILCASICALTYEQASKMISGPDWPRVIREWRIRIVGRFPLFRNKKLNEEKVIADFREYVVDGYRMPPLWLRQNASSIELTAPREAMLLNRLAAFGYSTVMNMYLPEAWYQYFSAVEISAADKFDGDVKNWAKMFFTQKDAMRMEALDGR